MGEDNKPLGQKVDEAKIMQNQQLKITLDNQILNISIGIEALKTSIECGRLDLCCAGKFKIFDINTFILDFVNELKSEEEDGSTHVDLMFDKVAMQTLENGGFGCDIYEVSN